MSTTTTAAAAIYLVHLNPMTNAHESIISTLKKDYRVYIFPVRFIKDGQEVNTKSSRFRTRYASRWLNLSLATPSQCFQIIPFTRRTTSTCHRSFRHGHGNSATR